MRTAILVLLLCFSSLGLAKQAHAQAPIACDVTYTVDTNAVDAQGVEFDVATSVSVVTGMPYADVLDNSAKAFKVVDLMSKLQDKGGPYVIETGEIRSCDGKPPEKVMATSVMVKGLTLEGSNRVAREALRQAAFVVDRYEGRAKKGDRMGWDHKKGHKTKRNDLRQKVTTFSSDSVIVSPNDEKSAKSK